MVNIRKVSALTGGAVVSLCRPFHPHTVLGQHRQEEGEGEDVNFAEPGEHTDTRRQNEREWRQQW